MYYGIHAYPEWRTPLSFRCPIDLYEVNVQRDIRLRHAVAASRACRIILRNVLMSVSLSFPLLPK